MTTAALPAPAPVPASSAPAAAPPSNLPAPRALIDYDFQSVLAAPPRQRFVLWLMVGLVVSCAIGLAVAQVNMVVSANGKIISSVPDILIQPLETSVVRSVKVKMGQKVKKGDVLATLDPTFTEADRAELASKLRSQQAAFDRLTAELSGKPYTVADPNVDESTQLDIFRKRAGEYIAHVASSERKAEQYKADLAAHKIDAQGLQQQIRLLAETEDIYKQLVAGNLASRLKLLDSTQRSVEMRSRLDTNLGEQAKLEQQIAEAYAERDTFTHEWDRKLSEEMATTRADRDGTAARLSKAHLRHELSIMTAPADATVLDVAKRPPGSVVREAEMLIRLVPSGDPMLAEIQVDTRDVGRLKTGDPVTLKLEALPWQQHGLAYGTLHSVTPDALADENERETADDMSSPGMKAQSRQAPIHYRAQVEITAAKFRNLPDSFELRPGMRVTGDIKVGRRSVLEYILNPITRVIDESLREP